MGASSALATASGVAQVNAARPRTPIPVDQDGATDEGELKTLTESGITSISLTRTDVAGTNHGHARSCRVLDFQGGFTRADGTTGTAETIYFATDRRDTRRPFDTCRFV